MREEGRDKVEVVHLRWGMARGGDTHAPVVSMIQTYTRMTPHHGQFSAVGKKEYEGYAVPDRSWPRAPFPATRAQRRATRHWRKTVYSDQVVHSHGWGP